jgi:murein DD-endopeptidase MepM/ murein hydrolase activator NlpD
VNAPVIALPFKGTWRVTQGHTCETNHRRGKLGGQFSWDFVAVSDAGQLGAADFDTSHRNDESATYGRPLISPVTGTVVSVVDGVDDNDGQKSFPRNSPAEATRHPRWFFGNHIVLDAGGGVFVLLAHLKKGSVTVARGAAVQAGDPIAQAGNSGNTMLPHVHIQVMDGADPAGASVTGIPALFRDYVEITSTGEPIERETLIRRIGVGDPPVDAIVLTPMPPRREP